MGILSKGVGILADWIKAGYPEEVAKRIVSGELPMDEASRMARAQGQGYGPVLYRGHGKDQPPTSDDIWWASDSKEMAGSYTNRGVRYDEDLDDFVDVEGTLTPIRTNGNKWFEVDAGGVNHEDLTANVPGHGVLKSTDQIGSVGSYQPGVHGSKITNVVDYYGPDGAPATSYNIRADLPNVNIRHADAAYDPQYTGSNIMGGALAGGVGLGALSQSEDADAGFITKGGKTLLEAWHGSPHKFDKFSMDQIGTGEGAQAYGHGLYFADSRDVAEGYKKTLEKGGGLSDDDTMARVLNSVDGDMEKAVAELRRRGNASLQGDTPENAKRFFRMAQRVDGGYDPRGSLYRTEIDVTPESLLDWDKPLSEQPQAVQDMANDYGLAGSFTPDGWLAKDWSDTRGSDVYKATYRQLRKDGLGHKEAQKAVSDAMREYDIKGLTYLDGNSRAVGDGTSNYVIFDDSLINIAERGNATAPALGVLATGTGAALTAPALKSEGLEKATGFLDSTIQSARDAAGPLSFLVPYEGISNFAKKWNADEELTWQDYLGLLDY